VLRLKCDEPLSKIAFKFNLRRYTAVGITHPTPPSAMFLTLGPHGEALQLQPMKLKLKAPGSPGTKRFTLICDFLLSSFAFNINSRRYSTGSCRRRRRWWSARRAPAPGPSRGWAVQLDPIKPTLKPPETKRLKLKYIELLTILLQISTCGIKAWQVATANQGWAVAHLVRRYSLT
jgi:hypothetical protein